MTIKEADEILTEAERKNPSRKAYFTELRRQVNEVAPYLHAALNALTEP